MAERKGRVTPTQSDAFIADLSKLGIERDDEASDRAFMRLLPLYRTRRLTSHDATDLNLAIRRSPPLVPFRYLQFFQLCDLTLPRT